MDSNENLQQQQSIWCRGSTPPANSRPLFALTPNPSCISLISLYAVNNPQFPIQKKKNTAQNQNPKIVKNL